MEGCLNEGWLSNYYDLKFEREEEEEDCQPAWLDCKTNTATSNQVFFVKEGKRKRKKGNSSVFPTKQPSSLPTCIYLLPELLLGTSYEGWATRGIAQITVVSSLASLLLYGKYLVSKIGFVASFSFSFARFSLSPPPLLLNDSGRRLKRLEYSRFNFLQPPRPTDRRRHQQPKNPFIHHRAFGIPILACLCRFFFFLSHQ